MEKSRLFPGATFVVGVDTCLRIADAKYYGGSAELRQSAIAEIARHGCRFLVVGRLVGDTYQTVNDLSLRRSLRTICDGVPEEMFRLDISSTQLRRSSPSVRGRV